MKDDGGDSKECRRIKIQNWGRGRLIGARINKNERGLLVKVDEMNVTR